ncbi:hypothetical protein BSR29_07965 [Boudabousia liubingyangii]|uniref:Uncharacterized protein n=1 Tax=Boudabousia liubingyangii TaxID=1921764 RepID=A0A1Q5PJW2_9ACTO|nr:hypothetical protein [Boudabousia liubingyangii]OKL46178.1 hypothetical protein BSR29_07965 [Boudabousia liubingyangii]
MEKLPKLPPGHLRGEDEAATIELIRLVEAGLVATNRLNQPSPRGKSAELNALAEAGQSAFQHLFWVYQPLIVELTNALCLGSAAVRKPWMRQLLLRKGGRTLRYALQSYDYQKDGELSAYISAQLSETIGKSLPLDGPRRLGSAV